MSIAPGSETSGKESIPVSRRQQARQRHQQGARSLADVVGLVLRVPRPQMHHADRADAAAVRGGSRESDSFHRRPQQGAPRPGRGAGHRPPRALLGCREGGRSDGGGRTAPVHASLRLTHQFPKASTFPACRFTIASRRPAAAACWPPDAGNGRIGAGLGAVARGSARRSARRIPLRGRRGGRPGSGWRSSAGTRTGGCSDTSSGGSGSSSPFRTCASRPCCSSGSPASSVTTAGAKS